VLAACSWRLLLPDGLKIHMSHSNHKEIHSDTEQIPTRGPQNEYPYDFIGKTLKNIREFSSATVLAGQSLVRKAVRCSPGSAL
jgi:hypothetical protein